MAGGGDGREGVKPRPMSKRSSVSLPRAPAGERGGSLFGRPALLVLVVAEKAVSALGAAGAVALILALGGRSGVEAAFVRLTQAISEDPDNVVTRWLAHHLPHHLGVPAGAVLWTGVGLAFWALLLGAEAVGLWRERFWGETLIIVETASFLPLEVWDILTHSHLAGVAGLAVNLVILVYVGSLVRKRRYARPPPTSTGGPADDRGRLERGAE